MADAERIPMDDTNIDTAGLVELVELVQWHVTAWQDHGYADPPAPECKTIPPLGERSASAIAAGHNAVRDIDRLARRLHEVRAALVAQLRRDEDIRMARLEGDAR